MPTPCLLWWRGLIHLPFPPYLFQFMVILTSDIMRDCVVSVHTSSKMWQLDSHMEIKWRRRYVKKTHTCQRKHFNTCTQSFCCWGRCKSCANMSKFKIIALIDIIIKLWHRETDCTLPHNSSLTSLLWLTSHSSAYLRWDNKSIQKLASLKTKIESGSV